MTRNHRLGGRKSRQRWQIAGFRWWFSRLTRNHDAEATLADSLLKQVATA